MDSEDRIKLYGMSLALVERDLDKVEDELGLNFQRIADDDKDDVYYPQFDLSLREVASQMATHYELFYCLEQNIRKLVADAIEGQFGENWWETCVPQNVKDNVKSNIKREAEQGVTPRSEYEIDYSNFGELGEIVRKNWTAFDSIFSTQKAFTKVMTSLNTLRNHIAHCCPMPPNEVVRLQLTLEDWFRLME